MRCALGLFLVAGLAVAHGGSGRQTPPPAPAPGGGGFGGPTGGPTTPSGGPGGKTTKTVATSKDPGWEVWWNYNREFYLTQRTKGAPVTGIGKRIPESQMKGTRAPKLLPVILEALDDKNHSVRAAAAVALGKFALPEARRALRRRMYMPPEKWYDVREACTYGLALLGLPEEHDTFVYFASDNQKVRQITPTQQGVALFGFLMDRTDKSLLSLEHYLTFKDSDVQYRGIVVPTRGEAERRRVAAHLFGFVESRQPYDKLLWKVVMNDKRYGPGERGLAVTAIGRLKKHEYLRDIRRLTHSRKQPREVQRSAVIALGQLTKRDDEDNLAELGRIATKGKDAVMRHFAVMGLGQIQGAGAGKRLVNIYNSNARPGNADRQFLCLALGLVKTRDARDTLQIAYEKAGAYEMWAPMMLGCGLAGNRDAVGLTIKRVEGASIVNRDVLAYGSMALGLMGDPKASKTVREVLRKYADPKIREHAAIGLVLLERNQAVPKLLELLKEGGSLQKKSSAIIALGLLASPSDEVVSELIRAYRKDSNNDAVRAAAIVALGAIADPRKMPLSAKLMRNYNYLIRSGALDLVASLL